MKEAPQDPEQQEAAAESDQLLENFVDLLAGCLQSHDLKGAKHVLWQLIPATPELVGQERKVYDLAVEEVPERSLPAPTWEEIAAA